MACKGIGREIELAGITGASVDHLDPEELIIRSEQLDEAGDELYPVLRAIAVGYSSARNAREQNIPPKQATRLFGLATEFAAAYLGHSS